MRSLNGENYTIMVLCKPVEEYEIQRKIDTAIDIQDKCFAISKRTVSLQNGTTDSKTHTDMHNESNGEQESMQKGMSVSGAAVGAALGSMIIPGGGMLGLIVGSQFSLNSSISKGVSHTLTDGYSDAVTKAVNSSESISGDVQNGFALELMKMSEKMLERLKIGRNIGMWEAVVTYSSDSEIASNIIQGNLYSEIASGETEILPPVVFSYKDSCFGEKGEVKNIHTQQLLIPKDFFSGVQNSPLCSLVTSEELCGICTIPVDNTVGFEINKSKGYSINSHADSADILLGNICEYDRPLSDIEFGLSEEDLNKHTFVCGITGSGKTNTEKEFLKRLISLFWFLNQQKKNIVI